MKDGYVLHFLYKSCRACLNAHGVKYVARIIFFVVNIIKNRYVECRYY